LNKWHIQRRDEEDDDYRGRIDQGGVEADNAYSSLLAAGFDLVPSGLNDHTRQYKLAPLVPVEPNIIVGSADGPEDAYSPCGDDDAIDLISGEEEEESAFSGKENNSKERKKKASDVDKKVVIKKSRLSNKKTEVPYELQLAVAEEKIKNLEKMNKRTYIVHCLLLDSYLFLFLYILSYRTSEFAEQV
jgi:hypothetical protein